MTPVPSALLNDAQEESHLPPANRVNASVPVVTLLHEGSNFAILHKPAGMPLSGTKPQTVLSAPLLAPHAQRAVAIGVPRPVSGPAVVSFRQETAAELKRLYDAGGMTFTFTAIVHGTPSVIEDAQHQVVNVIPSTAGPLSELKVITHASGHGLRTALQRAGTPAVGTVARSRKTHSSPTRGLFIACTSLSIPSLGVYVEMPVPQKFASLLAREEKFGLRKAEAQALRAETHVKIVDGTTHVRFMDWFFAVSEDVMTPRQSSEIVAGAAADFLRGAFRLNVKMGRLDPRPRLLDLGTGSGAIVIAAILSADVDALGTGVELSPDAAALARRNIVRHGLAERVDVVEADFGNLECLSSRFDVVVSNPPYLSRREFESDRHFFQGEPEAALVADDCGMAAYQAIARGISRVLCGNGVVVLEVGNRRNVAAVRSLYEEVGLLHVDVILDTNGFERCLVMRSPVHGTQCTAWR